MTLLATAPLPDIVEPPSGGAVVWVPSDGAVFVDGRYITGGMVYVARGGERSGSRCAILTDLPVGWDDPDSTGAAMHYGPTYRGCLPVERAAYLNWLIGGRRDPGAYIGHVFMFYYGLEQRLLDDLGCDWAHPETQILLEEVEQLAAVYSRDSDSFARYSGELLGFYAALRAAHADTDMEPIPPAGIGRQELHATVGRFVASGAGVPAAWAFEYLARHEEFSPRAAARNCRDVFRELFIVRFRDWWGDTIQLRPPRGNWLRLRCRPAIDWAMNGGVRVVRVDGIPDPDEAGLFDMLAPLGDECGKALTAYSRTAVSQPDDAGTAFGLSKLPDDLLTAGDYPLLRRLRAGVVSQLDRTGAGAMLWDDLMEMCFTRPPAGASTGASGLSAATAGSGRATKRAAEAVAVVLSRVGVGIEPDVRFGGAVPKAGSGVALFALPDGSGDVPSETYAAATLTARLAAVVGTADGPLSVAVQQHLASHAQTDLGLGPAEQARLDAHLRSHAAKATLSGVKTRAATLNAAQRRDLGEFLIAVAVADGQIAVAEITALTRIFDTVGLDTGDVYRRLHAHSTGDTTPAAQPGPAAATVTLDRQRVRARIADTARVEVLLAAIFGEADNTDPPAEPDAAAAAVLCVDGLDDAHSALAAAAAVEQSWARADLAAVAASLGLPLLDGALAEINEAAVVVCGEPLVEGDDPLQTNTYAATEML